MTTRIIQGSASKIKNALLLQLLISAANYETKALDVDEVPSSGFISRRQKRGITIIYDAPLPLIAGIPTEYTARKPESLLLLCREDVAG